MHAGVYVQTLKSFTLWDNPAHFDRTVETPVM